MTIIFTKVITEHEMKQLANPEVGDKQQQDQIKKLQVVMDNYQSVDFKILQSGFVAAFIATVFTFNPVGIGIAVAAYTAVAVNDSVRNYLSIKRIANEYPNSPANKMLNRQALVLAFATFLNFATFYISSVVGDNVSDKSMLAGLRVGIRGYDRINQKSGWCS